MINEIWANRLIAGTKTWAQLPQSRHAAVKAVLSERVTAGEITVEEYQAITGEVYLQN